MDTEKYKAQYIHESREYLKKMDSSILSLEKNPADTDQIDAVFRYIHSLKGMSATMGYGHIRELAHRLESYLDTFRRGKKVLDGAAIDPLLRGVDSLSRLVEAVVSPPPKNTVTSTGPSRPPRDKTATLRVQASLIDELVDSIGELLVTQSRLLSLLGPPSRSHQFPSGTSAGGEQPVRIDPDLCDQTLREEGPMKEALDVLNHQIQSFHSKILGLRLTPLSSIADKYPRAIRDIARQRGKQVDFCIDDEGVELDRRILEELDTPILHMLRNSVDHGIEPPEDRIAAKKEKSGKVTLKARRERDHAVIEVSDDGAGMNPDALKAKAISQGVLSPEQAGALSSEDALFLACLPGVSTAGTVTEISGRGVGMNIVKSKIESLGGHLTLISSPGHGTRVSMTIPVSVSIVPVLLVNLPPYVCGLPLSRVEIVLKEKDADTRRHHCTQHLLYDGETVPVEDLRTLLSLSEESDSSLKGGHLIVCNVRGKRKALRVGPHLSCQMAYLRPLRSPLNKITGLFGTTLLGDGRLIFILDPQGLFV